MKKDGIGSRTDPCFGSDDILRFPIWAHNIWHITGKNIQLLRIQKAA